jgi:hypothetical protein
MPFTFNINEHDAVAYVKIQILGKAIHEAALLAYYCDGRKKQMFHEEMERELASLLALLQIDERATANAIDEATENYQYQIENLRAALRVIEDLPPRDVESAWQIATRALREDDEFAAMPASPIR